MRLKVQNYCKKFGQFKKKQYFCTLFRSKSPMGPPKILIFGESVAQNVGVIERHSCESREVLMQACPLVYRYYTGFWFREARFDSSVDNKANN